MSMIDPIQALPQHYFAHALIWMMMSASHDNQDEEVVTRAPCWGGGHFVHWTSPKNAPRGLSP